jgi:tricorn protease-like protein
MEADPSGTYVLYRLGEEGIAFQLAYVARGSEVLTSTAVFGQARWSPDGRRFAAQSVTEGQEPGPIYLHDVESGRGEHLAATGLPDWFPEGDRLVYVYNDDVFSYDLATNESTKLTDLPHDEQNAWVVQEAHALASGRGVIFFGGKFREDGQLMLGASGNGQQWWWIPETGGTPQPWTELGGNAVVGYAPAPGGERVAYAETAHGNACYSFQAVTVAEASRDAGTLRVSDIPDYDEQQEQYVFIQGLTWSPDGNKVAFGVEPYRCPEEGSEWDRDTPRIYIWDLEGGEPRRLVDGSYPTWTR